MKPLPQPAPVATTATASGMDVVALRRGGSAPLHGVSFRAEPGETTVLLSSDGSGGAALRAALGFEPVDGGRSTVGGVELVPSSGTGPHPEQVGILVRDPVVTPGRTLNEHLLQGFPPERRRAECYRRIQGLGDSLGFVNAGSAIVSELPLPLQYRVAIGRAAAAQPALIAADDPYELLPARERHLLASLLRAIANEADIGVVHATRDPELASRASHVVLFDAGRVVAEARGTLCIQQLLGRGRD